MKKIKLICVILFLGICFAQSTVTIVNQNPRITLNEQAVTLPSLINENGINNSFSKDFETYYSQKNPLRTTYISLNNFLKIEFLNSSSSDVIAGKEGYLFYGKTMSDYMNQTLSDRKIYNIARTVELVQNHVQNKGKKFVFTVAPNKNSIYPQFVRERYIKGNKSNLDVLTNFLKEKSINYVDLKEQFLNDEQELYLKKDSHWNNLGALYGYNSIENGLGHAHKTYNNLEYKVQDNYIGDLSKMAFPELSITCEQYYFDYELKDFRFKRPFGVKDNKMELQKLQGTDAEKYDSVISTIGRNGNNSLYMIRDSFGRALLPFFIDNYKETFIERINTPSTGFDDGNYDYFVWEIVERNLDKILRGDNPSASAEYYNAPQLYANKEDFPLNYSTLSGKNDVKYEVNSNYNQLRIYGSVDPKYFSVKSDIFVCLTNNEEKLYYSAYPIFENYKLDCNEDNEYGFSLMIDTSNLKHNNYKVALFVENNGKAVSTGELTTIKVNN